jgi:squalene-hopene/tetraprenyl-beta-curcumene cyclase
VPGAGESPRSGKAVEEAVLGGVDFLVAGRDADGWWLDFEVRGPGQFWATAFVGASLAKVTDERAQEIARAAWDLLAGARGPSAGWGYGPQVPGDADITSWALRLAEAVGAGDHPRAAEGYAFVLRHVRPDGGLTSYVPAVAAGFLERVAPRWDGWYASHTCVTSAGAGLTGLPQRERLIEYLRAHRAPDGYWAAYWWADREYATALAAETLATTGAEVDLALAETAGRWAAGRIGDDGSVRTDLEPNGSAYATAFALRALLATPMWRDSEEAGRAVDWLLGAQRPDGSWSPSAWCRVPYPEQMDPNEQEHWELHGRGRLAFGTVVLDNGLYTTAAVVAALSGVPT